MPVSGMRRFRPPLRSFGFFVATASGCGVVIGLAHNQSPLVVTTMTSLVVVIGAYLVMTSRPGGPEDDDR